MYLVLIAVTCRTWPGILVFPGFWFSGREGHEIPAYFLVWPEKTLFCGQAYRKTLALTGLTRLFQAMLSWQARPRPSQAWLGWACHAFDRAPDAREGKSTPSTEYLSELCVDSWCSHFITPDNVPRQKVDRVFDLPLGRGDFKVRKGEGT